MEWQEASAVHWCGLPQCFTKRQRAARKSMGLCFPYSMGVSSCQTMGVASPHSLGVNTCQAMGLTSVILFPRTGRNQSAKREGPACTE